MEMLVMMVKLMLEETPAREVGSDVLFVAKLS